MKILVVAIGRPKTRPVGELVEQYSKRLMHYAPFEIQMCRDEARALGKIGPRDYFVVLDETGRQKSSRELSEFIASHRMQGTKRMVFFIGGEDGSGMEIKKRANMILGLSKMTFPHELALVILLEQLYRSFTIIKGEPYHRD